MRPQHKFDWNHFWKWLPAYLAATLVIYVLAAGPLYYPIYYGVYSGTNPVLVRLYMPLLVLCDAVPAIGAAMDWYLQFWV
ncbi:hypothetical protein [Alienimonas chondri]|uniref:Uncharacterized protein n=1 Tax=Alienimonas chondri TaxID=2681879 RepID=A0ABX1V895_9PLAN|nr:hypothetical protein [Alienimonas chondri]NNJ24142.1 hypothetical protein [Alienimonas chondri]